MCVCGGGDLDHWRQEGSNRSGNMKIIKILAGSWPWSCRHAALVCVVDTHLPATVPQDVEMCVCVCVCAHRTSVRCVSEYILWDYLPGWITRVCAILLLMICAENYEDINKFNMPYVT